MSDLHARGRFNGAVVLGRDGEILYENAWGPANVEAGVPFTPDTPVDGASLCKTFIAAAVWMLVDEGKLDLDAPVQRYLPEYPHAVTTVRNLIEFSSGLPDLDEFENMLSSEALTAERMLDAIREHGTLPAFDPGSTYEYSSLGFEVAALVVERVSGLEFEAFLQQRVFQPLGMDSSFARPARLADWRGARTLSYRHVDGVRTLYDVWDNDGTYGLYFSARDLFRWATSFYSRPVLSPTALSRGLKAPVFGGGERSALNRLSWYYSDDHRRFYFNGHWRGFHHEVYWDVDHRLTIVWVTNDEEAKPLPQFLTLALIDIMDGRIPDPIADPDFGGPGPGESLAPVAGSYVVDGLGPVTMIVDGDHARLKIGNGIEHKCWGSDGFYVPDHDAEIGFSELQGGLYQRLHWVSVFRQTTGTRLASKE